VRPEAAGEVPESVAADVVIGETASGAEDEAGDDEEGRP
jgi:hypothetical protein